MHGNIALQLQIMVEYHCILIAQDVFHLLDKLRALKCDCAHDSV